MTNRSRNCRNWLNDHQCILSIGIALVVWAAMVLLAAASIVVTARIRG